MKKIKKIIATVLMLSILATILVAAPLPKLAEAYNGNTDFKIILSQTSSAPLRNQG